ncbi:MAG: yfiR [Verrucomicrobiales bacterium]|nr:yfiR [Verrucomicrobiales bacterium]
MPILKADLSGKRLRELAEAATDVFCRRGYERSQMSDVAKVMGVAVGTVYLYVSGKEALFDLTIRHGSEENESWMDALEIPIQPPAPGATMAYLEEVFRRTEWPLLAKALRKKQVENAAAELDGVLREQFGLMRRHRRGLLLLMRSALEFPGLTQVFIHGLRDRLLDQFAKLLRIRAAAGQYRAVSEVRATAATVIQTISWANLQRPLDPGLLSMDEAAVETSVVELLANGLLA